MRFNSGGLVTDFVPKRVKAPERVLSLYETQIFIAAWPELGS